jgi:hypothetical protein
VGEGGHGSWRGVSRRSGPERTCPSYDPPPRRTYAAVTYFRSPRRRAALRAAARSRSGRRRARRRTSC